MNNAKIVNITSSTKHLINIWNNWLINANTKNHALNVFLHYQEKPTQLIKLVEIICHIPKLNVMPVWPQQSLSANKATRIYKKLKL